MFIIKAGTCAVLDNDIKLKKIIIPKFIKYSENDRELNLSNLPLNILNLFEPYIMNEKLLTVDKPLFSKKKSEKLYREDITFIDMETFHVAEKFNKEIVIPVLVGTDRGDGSTMKDFFLNIREVSDILRDFVITIINII